jgi:hypothetical protein
MRQTRYKTQAGPNTNAGSSIFQQSGPVVAVLPQPLLPEDDPLAVLLPVPALQVKLPAAVLEVMMMMMNVLMTMSPTRSWFSSSMKALP